MNSLIPRLSPPEESLGPRLIANKRLSDDGSKMTLYADDVLLYRYIETPQDYQTLQDDLNSISEWVSENHLSFNVSNF